MIGAIENGLTEVLRAAGAAGVLGYRYATLESYPENFDQYLKEKGQLRTPAAWAVFLGLTDDPDKKDTSEWHGVAKFALVVAAQNLRNKTASRHGGPDRQSEPGSYQLAMDAAQLLHRNLLEPLDLVQPVRFHGMRLVARDGEVRRQGLSLMALELSCGASFDQEDWGNVFPFTHFHADWDIPPHGSVQAPLPAEDTDAEDLVELPQ